MDISKLPLMFIGLMRAGRVEQRLEQQLDWMLTPH